METVRKAKSQPRKNQSYQNAWICFKTILPYNKYEYFTFGYYLLFESQFNTAFHERDHVLRQISMDIFLLKGCCLCNAQTF